MTNITYLTFKRVALLASLLILLNVVYGQKKKQAGIKWLSLSEVDSLMKIEQRPILIDLYTTWCGWCRVMDKKTYSDAKVIAFVSQYFYPVKFDAESKTAFTWSKYKFSFDKQYGVNEFTIYLTKGKFYFPQTVFLLPQNPQPQAVSGYLDAKEMMELLGKVVE